MSPERVSLGEEGGRLLFYILINLLVMFGGINHVKRLSSEKIKL